MPSFKILAVVWAFWALGGGREAHIAGPVPVTSPETAAGAAAADEGLKTVPLEKAGLQALWRLKVRLVVRERIVRLFLLDENLYCLTSKARLVALDARRGLTKWVYDVPAAGGPVFAPIHPPVPVTLRVGTGEQREDKTFKAVILNTLTRLIVLDRTSGQVMRNLKLEHPANSAGASDGTNAYIGSVKGSYHAFTLNKALKIWSWRTGAMITAPVMYSHDHVYVASEDNKLYVNRADSRGTKVWQREFGAPVVAAFAVTGQACFVPCTDGKLYALNAFTGQEIWEPFICRGPLTTPVQLGRNALFQYAEGDNFYAISLRNGAEMWKIPAGRLVVATIGKDVYVLDKDANVRIVDEMRGKLKAAVSLDKLRVFAPNTTHPGIYGASISGWVICINPIARGHLTPDMFKD